MIIIVVAIPMIVLTLDTAELIDSEKANTKIAAK
jgi:hypothetical protein